MEAREHWRAPRVEPVDRERPLNRDRIVGVDGEGLDRAPHRYVYLCAVDEGGTQWDVHDPNGLSTADCLDLLCELPDRALVVSFASHYDLTKILADLPDADLYALFHPERERAYVKRGRVEYAPVRWRGYRLNYINRRFTVARQKKRVTLWDVFAFFQSKFTKALRDWRVGSVREVAEIEAMKDQRNRLKDLPLSEVQAYCQSECGRLADLTRALVDAHDRAGLPLKTFFGAGSTATALLTKLGIKERVREAVFPEAMLDPVARAFFGGRFEHSCVGPIRGPVWNYDISSAYPYQTTQLPCLTCGKWERVTGRALQRAVETASLALVHWRSRRARLINLAWGPLPVRAADGTIAFPLAARGGWCWRAEYLAAQRLFPNVTASEAWVYGTECDHRPFRDVPATYAERCRIGKDGPGIVLKLGLNSIYGKLAQSLGLNPSFQCWVWAGCITSGCRAQLLESLAVGDRWDVLMFATDGVWTRRELDLPAPLDTGTAGTGKPLGGWECKRFDRGVFAVRPGIYFPLDPTEEELKEVRARGLGKKTLYEQWGRIVEAWDRDGVAAEVKLANIERFVGALSGVRKNQHTGEVTRSADYGEWVEFPIRVTFDPRPKRERALGQRLQCWGYLDWESHPYSQATESPEAAALREFTRIALEQPDGDFAEG